MGIELGPLIGKHAKYPPWLHDHHGSELILSITFVCLDKKLILTLLTPNIHLKLLSFCVFASCHIIQVGFILVIVYSLNSVHHGVLMDLVLLGVEKLVALELSTLVALVQHWSTPCPQVNGTILVVLVVIVSGECTHLFLSDTDSNFMSKKSTFWKKIYYILGIWCESHIGYMVHY